MPLSQKGNFELDTTKEEWAKVDSWSLIPGLWEAGSDKKGAPERVN